MKKLTYLISFLVILTFGYSWFYGTQYHIEDNQDAVQSNLKEWSNRGSEDINPDVIKIVQLDDTRSYILLYQTQSKDIGYAHMIKGWNGKYKMDQSGYGTNIVDYQNVETNQGTYGVVYGRNPDLEIDYFAVNLADEPFRFTAGVKDDENFVRYKKFPKDIKDPFPAHLSFYNKNGAEIKSPPRTIK
ncbi:hypothetical protein [Halobacillus litoralis]|uniref:hypothetical protein n=1 Tax=Halobacillus litoralis TaxID=45668 RepID=UPI001CFE1DAD|nr:hypothetical protein [Halobacillus litoralis]